MSAPFYEISFPAHIAAGAEAVVRSRTGLQTMSGGGERRNKRWQSQLREWDAQRGITSLEDFELVRALHINMDGRYAGFRFQDFSDYHAEQQRLDTSSGGAGPFQLRKGYVVAGHLETLTRWRTITKPMPGACALYLGGLRVALTWTGLSSVVVPAWAQLQAGESYGTRAANIDFKTGLITMTSPTNLTGSSQLKASFDFECKVRFGSDDFSARAVERGKAWNIGSVPIMETR